MAEHAHVTIGGHRIDITSPDKALFPEDGITKLHLIRYYEKVAGVMLRHLRGRPVMLQRFPDGIAEQGFLQTDASDYFPEWIRRVEVAKQGGTLDMVVCDNAATLVYLAGQACVTFHTWLSRTDRPHHPDRVVFDLDPSDGDFDAVRRAARAVRDLLDDAGLVPFLQTTGSRGMHVVAPLDRRADFDEVRAFARDVAERVVDGDPDRYTVEQRKAKRQGRVFIDTLRNAYAQTGVAPYSVRPRPGAPVATPLEWHELSARGLEPQRYRAATISRRLARRQDPWATIDRRSRSLTRARRRLDQRHPAA